MSAGNFLLPAAGLSGNDNDLTTAWPEQWFGKIATRTSSVTSLNWEGNSNLIIYYYDI
jgi:hypothetical protein